MCGKVISNAVAALSFATVALAATGSSSGVLKDRWFYCERRPNSASDVAFVTNLIAVAAGSGLNGMVYQCDLELWARWPEAKRAGLRKVKSFCDEKGIELIPLIWSVGYGSMLGVEPGLVETIALTDMNFVRQGDELTFVPESVSFENAGFERADTKSNGFAGWTVDMPGVECFVDESVSHEGRRSVRIEPTESGNPNGHARICQHLDLKPNHAYRFSVWVKVGDSCFGDYDIRMHVFPKGGSLGPAIGSSFVRGIGETDGWRRFTCSFETGVCGAVTVWMGSWGAKRGVFWLDDAEIEEVAPRAAALKPWRTVGVSSAESGTLFEEGRDWNILPGKVLALVVPEKSAIREGERLRVCAQVPATGGHLRQTSACMSDPRLYDYFRMSAKDIREVCNPRKWFLSMDEIRNGGTCPLCRARKTDMAHILSDCIRKQCDIIRKERPDAEIYCWHDMFDPSSNAREKYDGCVGSYLGIWDLIPKDIVISCWGRKPLVKSLRFFSMHGFRVQAATYYEGKDLSDDAAWLSEMLRTPGATGMMYTTWQERYDLLPEYGRMLIGAKVEPY